MTRICANAEKMGRLIIDLLALSRLDRAAMTMATVDMTALARRCAEELAPACEGRDVVFDIRGMAPATGDENLLREVFANLLSNAVKYTRPRAQARIEAGSCVSQGETIYYVKDNGVGFDTAYAANIFKPFTRLHRESEFEGSGVGLSIVQRIAARHGGRVWVSARPDEGAEFCFTLMPGWENDGK